MDFTGIFQEKDGTYSYRIKKVLPNGEKIDTKKKGFSTKRDAKIARDNRLSELSNMQRKTLIKRIRFDQLYEKFIDHEAKGNRKYGTILRYESLYKNYLKPIFGDRWVESILTGEINKFLRDLKNQNKSYSYIESFLKQLNVLFKFAVANQYLDINPAETAQMPQKDITREHKKQQEQKVFSAEHIKLLEERLSHSGNLTPFLLGYYMGLRVSEAYAIRWSDIDFEAKTIRIDKQMQYQDFQWCLVPPKSFKGYRILEMPDILVEHLREKQAEQELNRKKYGSAYAINRVQIRLKPNQDKTTIIPDFISIKSKGEMLTPNSSKYITVVAKELGIPNYRFHHLRHTHASILANQNISTILLKERLGHEKIETVWAFYTHATEEAKHYMVDTLNQAYVRKCE